MSLWLNVVNSLMAPGSTAFGVLVLVQPEALNEPRGGGRALGECGGSGMRSDVEAACLYAVMYAERAVPLGSTVSAVAWAAPDGRATALLLGVAVAAQIADIVTAVANRLKGMAIGAAFVILVHATALAATL